MRVPKKIKSNEHAEKFFSGKALKQIPELWRKSYGMFLEAKDGKSYFVSYEFGNGSNSHLKVQDFSWAQGPNS